MGATDRFEAVLPIGFKVKLCASLRCAAPVLAMAIGASAGDAIAGGMLLSGRDRGLAINAWGGARLGTVLRLHNGCRQDNPDCTWTYTRGMLVSDRNPRLAVAVDDFQDGAELKLKDNCTTTDPTCLWDYRNGMFVSQTNRSFAINAWGGARYGTVLRLSRDCRPDNPDCTWSR